MRDFIEAAASTNSNTFYGEMVGLFYLRKALQDFVAAGQHLDNVKKTLFYGRRLYDVEKHHRWGVDLVPLVGLIDPNIIHGIIGQATESTELIEALLAGIERFIEGKPVALDHVNLLEETGDTMWYQAILLRALGSDFATEGRRVIAKLMLRYPDGFTEENALVRDLRRERALLEATPNAEGVFTIPQPVEADE